MEEIGNFILPALHRLFGSEFTTFDLYDEQGRMVFFRHLPAADFSHLVEPFQAFFGDHPVAREWQGYSQRGLIMHLSAMIPVRQFIRTGLFNEVYRHQHVKYQIGFAGMADATTTWSVATGRLIRDYGPREIELARFLRPRLCQAITRAARCADGRRVGAALCALFSDASVAYALVADGRLLELSPAARQLLERSLAGGLPDPSRLPPNCAELVRAVRAQSAKSGAGFTLLPVGPLRALVFRPPALGPALVVFQEPDSAHATRPKLTRREAEILTWLGEGKTNPEIALLLGISARTVDKHCQSLFAKLGVESRLGAALLGRPAV